MKHITPKRVDFFQKNQIKIKSTAVGENHSYALSEAGEVYSFGFGGKPGLLSLIKSEDTGALGHNDRLHQLLPRKIQYFANEKIKVAQIASGRYHGVALSTEGRLFTWGKGTYGALGTGKAASKRLPTELTSLQPMKITKIDSADSYTAALTGKIYYSQYE